MMKHLHYTPLTVISVMTKHNLFPIFICKIMKHLHYTLIATCVMMK